MTNEEINEYLAENLMGLERNNDFGECECEFESGFIGFHCKNCGKTRDTDPEFDEYVTDYCYKEAPNYIEEWQQVIHKFIENFDSNISFFKLGTIPETYACGIDNYTCPITDDPIYAIQEEGDTIGEAVCKAVVEFLKGGNKNE